MPKTQMQLANRAWRIETKALGWHRGWEKGRKQWKEFCRRNAEITIDSRQRSEEPDFEDIGDACWNVAEELTYWTP
ncbi:hypothetical protein [Erwinia rhapontici]|uniref:hypothetical protein n=1 Tax=Erwinia rhapontici TaxID=55212 RepID=UPI0021695E83|nr:hypothetical protein [Erwinia rhapontici]MCS3605287.1 hypothetical protein [Erwinia rhapontici]